MRQLPFEYAFRNLGRSGVRLAASLFGSTLVVLLVLTAGGFVRGMQLTLTQHSPLHENVILLGTGSEEAIERSQIDAGVPTQAVASIPGIREAAGQSFVSPEIHMALPLRLDKDDPEGRDSVLRGVERVALLVHPEVEIVAGRFPRQGEDEIMLGSLAHAHLGVPVERVAVGQTLHFDNRDWTITGRFAAPTTVMDAEVWIPLTDLQIATKREASLSCVVLSLNEATFADVDLFARSRLDLELSAIPEREYYASIARFYRPIRAMIMVTAALIAAGGLLGGLNTMYAAFASRVREVGMLQSLGFTRPAIVIGLVEESTFAAACGAIIATIAALLLLDGLAIRFSMGAFALTLDAPVVMAGIVAGLAVGIIGAMPPAIRCLRLPITEALRAH
jgi:putative ABC transport system permease protein